MFKGPLTLNRQGIRCDGCQLSHPSVDGIPDFIVQEFEASPNLKSLRGIDLFAPIYETRLWYPFVLNLSGGLGSAALENLRQRVVEPVKVERGLILDAACGPGTLSRRLASPTRTVYGVDFSAAMLRQGLSYVLRDFTRNVHFARARVEALPFRDD